MSFIVSLVQIEIMDPADGEDYDMLDLLAYNCSTLTAQLSETKSAEEQEKLLSDYLKRVDKEFEPINELKEGSFHSKC